jgi:hypothetical protein
LAIFAALAATLGFIRRRSREGERSERMEKDVRGAKRIIEEIFDGKYELARADRLRRVGHDPAQPADHGPEGVASARLPRRVPGSLTLTVNQRIGDKDAVATRWTRDAQG